MRIVVYVSILALLLLAPVDRLDVAKLEPVEIVYVSNSNGIVSISTDTGAHGSGKSIIEALDMLHATTPGVVYLDTAEYLLLNRAASEQIDQLRGYFHGSVRLCLAESVDYKDLAIFLETHGEFPCLRAWKTGEMLPELVDGKIV